MKSSYTPIIALTLISASASAQSSPPAITPANLVGTWAMTKNYGDTYFLIMRPDSTFGWSYDAKTFKHWRALRGDTIVLQSEPGYRITLKDEVLTLTHLGKAPEGLGPIEDTYRRLDASTPLPQSFLTGLTGTWIGQGFRDTLWLQTPQGSRDMLVRVDTVTFRPDSTTNLLEMKKEQFQRWHHLRADTLWIGWHTPVQVTLKDQQLVVVGRNGGKTRVYQRADASKPAP